MAVFRDMIISAEEILLGSVKKMHWKIISAIVYSAVLSGLIYSFT